MVVLPLHSFATLFVLFTVGHAFALPDSAASDAHPSFRFPPKRGLNVAAKAARKLYLGTATNAEQWTDTAYFNILKNTADCGQITAANVMKWVRSTGLFLFASLSLSVPAIIKH